MPDTAIIITDADLKPLLDDPAGIDGAIDICEQSLLAFHAGKVREHNIEDRTETDPVNVMQIHMAAADGIVTGYQMFAEEASGDSPTLPNARFVTLLDAATRQLLALVPYAQLSPVRVGASAGVMCRYLAPQGATTAAIIGSGKQARRQLQAIVRTVPSIKAARVYSPTAANREAFAADTSAWLGIDVQPAATAQAAIEGADIVDIANGAKDVVMQMEWVKPGALVIPIGGGQLPGSVLQGHRIVATTWAQMARGRNPYSAAIQAGTFTRDMIAGEMADVVLGKVQVRRQPTDTVVFELGRINIWAVAVCNWAAAWARQHGAGISFRLT